MIRKVPIIGPSATGSDIAYVIRRAGRASSSRADFTSAISGYAGSRHVYLTNSGVSSFYVILRALKEISDRNEVILPAYTAGSLVVAVRKAGLKPVLCDISLEDFNLDEKFLKHAISPNTLAVVVVHMFGINMSGITELRAKIPDEAFLIEDCAQSMGSRTEDKECGSFGDASFFSFNRGKNFPLYGGGSIITNNGRISAYIGKEVERLGEEGVLAKMSAPLKILAFSIAGNPLIYGLGFSLISCFKETAPPKNFTVKKMDNLRSGLGLALMKKCEDLFLARHRNGALLINGLKDLDGIMLPKIPGNTNYVFNRLPVIFKDVKAMLIAKAALWRGGIEASRMYCRPLHHMFDIGYAENDFPNAVYCAQRLLTLPTHPGVVKSAVDKMIRIIRGVSV